MLKEKKERKASVAQMLAKLEGIKFEPKELVDNWILLTYDLPAGEEGGKARYQFLKKVPRIGGIMHTRSVYLIPWSEEAEIAAYEVAKAGQAFLWISNIKDEIKKKELTEFYDKEIYERLNDIASRIKRIKKHLENNEERSANRMIRKTGELLNDVTVAATHRNSIKILAKVTQLYKELIEIGNEKGTNEIHNLK